MKGHQCSSKGVLWPFGLDVKVQRLKQVLCHSTLEGGGGVVGRGVDS